MIRVISWAVILALLVAFWSLVAVSVNQVFEVVP